MKIMERVENARGRLSGGSTPGWWGELTSSPSFTVLMLLTLFVVGCWLAGGVP